MKLAIACDHAGFDLKEELKSFLVESGNEVSDLGTNDTTPVDYPDFAEAIALAVRDGKVERGVLICGSGVGAAIAANKIPGIRAGLCHDGYSAHQGVEHDNMNVLCLGARVIDIEEARVLTHLFIGAKFSNEPRHVRRIEKIRLLEIKYAEKLVVFDRGA